MPPSSLASGLIGRVPSQPTGYRPDVDGLRAIAVLAVMAYHLGFRPLAGGFVGVDIFFVISGYLIGSLVLGEAKANTFSFTRFYVRRIRRLFPALFVMLAVTAAASAAILYPDTFVDFGQSLAAAVTSTSNIYFWLTSDYFDTASVTNPLLHTWSLSVEEQFYLVFPALALWVLRRAPERLRFVILAIGVVSFAASFISTTLAPEAAFYLLPNRAWELALGIYLAASSAYVWSLLRRSFVAIGGMALIAVSILAFDGESLGLAPVPACVGTAMVIAAGRAGDNFVSAVLSWRPLVFVGLISYSLYLWHWPIIVLYQYRFGETFLELIEKFELIPLIFAAAILSYYFVERPFRRGPSDGGKVFFAVGASAAAIATAAVAIVALRGLPARFSPDVVRIANYLDYDDDHPAETRACLLTESTGSTFDDFDRAHCLRRAIDRPNILLVGDSHAANLREGLDYALPRANIMQATATQCRPVVRRQLRDAAACRRLMDFIYSEYLPNNRVDLLVLAGRWTLSDVDEVSETLVRLNRLRVPVVLVGPFPRYRGAVPQLVALARQTDNPGLPEERLRPGVLRVDRQLRALARQHRVRYASAYDVLCPNRDCMQLNAEGIPFQHDYGHLTREGSIYIADHLARRGAFTVGQATAHRSRDGRLE